MAGLDRELLRRYFSGPKGRKRHYRWFPDDVELATRRLPDHVITFHTHDVIGRELYINGQWQREELDRALTLLTEHSCLSGSSNVAVDLGANIGTQTLYLLLSKQFRKVVAVEPEPGNIALLKRNLADNALEDSAVVVERAVGSESGKTRLSVSPSNSGGHTTMNTSASAHSIEVDCAPISEILSLGTVDPSEINLFWIDLEGLEYEALRQIADLCPHAPPVYVEFSAHKYDTDTLDSFVELIRRQYGSYYKFDAGKSGDLCATADFTVPEQQADLLLLNAG